MTTKILAGYHANNENRQVTPDPYICPETMYCPEGTQLALSCPDGFWTPWQGAQSENECVTCQRGKWCKFATMAADADFQSWMTSNPSWTIASITSARPDIINRFYGDCSAGYICLEGATSSTPNSISDGGGYPCPIGFYCPNGVTIEIPCPPGTYNPDTQQATCRACTSSNYCPDFQMTTVTECLAGSYCPGDTDNDGVGDIYPTPCPVGTFNSPAGSSSDSQCTQCTATKYCDTVGQTDVTDRCADGFICVGGDSRPGPYATTYDVPTSQPSG